MGSQDGESLERIKDEMSANMSNPRSGDPLEEREEESGEHHRDIKKTSESVE